MKYENALTTRSILVMVIALFLVMFSFDTALAVSLRGYDVVAENENLILFFNEKTTEVAVYDQRTEEFWYSNPPDRASVEKIARGAAKEALSAQFRITYYTPADVQRSMDNYNDSIVYEQYDVEPIENGVRVNFTLGQEWADQYYLPLVIEQSIFEERFYAELSSAQKRTIDGLYAFVEVVEPPEGTAPTLVGKYVIQSPDNSLASRDQRTIHNVLLDHVYKYNEGLSATKDIKEEHVLPFVGQQFYILKQREQDMLPWDKTGVTDITREVGFDPLQIGESYELFGMDPGKPNIVTFKVPIEYTLDGDNLIVSVPVADVEYPINVLVEDGQRSTYPLTQINILPYFGATDSTSTGYHFVPDGSGALIHHNNGKTYLNSYSRVVYGSDYAVSAALEFNQTQQNYLPVFGITQRDRALFAIIEDGASIARINADIAGRRISYNTVGALFQVLEQAVSSLQADMPDIHGASAQWVQSGRDKINIYQEEIYDGDLTIRYAFLPEEDADYVGMAHYYQKYLVENGALTKNESQANIPLFVELVGAVVDSKPIMGVPRDVVIPLTTFDKASDIVQNLYDKNITNLRVTYRGWMEGGYAHGYPTKVRLEKALGTKAELESLAGLIKQNDGQFYPSVYFQHVFRDRFLDGFRAVRDGARALNRQPAIGLTGWGNLVSPVKLNDLVSNYLRSYADYELTGIHASDLTSYLYSDYRLGELVLKENVIQTLQEQLRKMTDDYGLAVQSVMPNAYALPWLDSITQVPLKDSGMDIVDEGVPFVSIFLHGYVDYAGEPLNFSDDNEEYLLRMVESGANPYFLGFAENASVLKGSRYAGYYTGQFTTWEGEVAQVYKMFNDIFSDVQDQIITDHIKIADNVYQTVYESGLATIVNYNDDSVMVEGISIAPRSFHVIKGE